jgi:hypothetical protein
VARQAGDVKRYGRYRDGLERCLQFLTTLQYTQDNTQHFADWYRQGQGRGAWRAGLLGGFCASHHDGSLRIDYAQHAVSAMVQYFYYVCD